MFCLFMPFRKLPFGDTKIFNVVVEVPAGSQKKYEYDPALGVMKLEKVLYDNVTFPFNYGHIPQTIAPDDYPLDVFIISTYPLHTGIVVECRPVGLLEVTDRGRRDNKILAIPISDLRLRGIQDEGDLPREYLDKIREFYGKLPGAWDHEIKLLGIKDKQAAVKELLRTLEFGV